MSNYSEPKSYMFTDQLWIAIWREIKDWDINVPSQYVGYTGATGNHVSAIYLAVINSLEQEFREVLNGIENKKRL